MSFFLSDRKRRTYLCSTLPQNLSPKKLSLKDRRFLQKNIRNYRDSYSFLLIKQQKLLYLKHIGKKSSADQSLYHGGSFFLRENPYILYKHLYFQVWQKSQHYKTICPIASLKTFPSDKTRVKKPFERTRSSGHYKNVPLAQNGQTEKLFSSSIFNPKSWSKEPEQSFKPTVKQSFNPISLKKKDSLYPFYNCLSPTFLSFEEKKNYIERQKGEFKKIKVLGLEDKVYNFENSKSLGKSLSIYVQTIKTRAITSTGQVTFLPGEIKKTNSWSKALDQRFGSLDKAKLKTQNLEFRIDPTSKTEGTSPKDQIQGNRNDQAKALKLGLDKRFSSEKLKQSFGPWQYQGPGQSQSKEPHQIPRSKNNSHGYFAKPSEIITSCLLKPNLSFSLCKTYASPPQFVNGGSKYLYCRYLYSGEQLKTSINPQNIAKTLNPGAKLLHERKKIRLFYGSLSLRDIFIHCRNAKRLPGFFEDNLYTLLESRYDVLIFRAGFSSTISAARHLIRRGFFFVNGKPLCSTKILGKPGDVLTYKPTGPKHEHYRHTVKALYNLYLLTDAERATRVKKSIFRGLRSFGPTAINTLNPNNLQFENSRSLQSSKITFFFPKKRREVLEEPPQKSTFIKGTGFSQDKQNIHIYKKKIIEYGENPNLCILYPGFFVYQNLSRKQSLCPGLKTSHTIDSTKSLGYFARPGSKVWTFGPDLKNQAQGIKPLVLDPPGNLITAKKKNPKSLRQKYSFQCPGFFYKNLNYISREIELLRLNVYCAGFLKDGLTVRKKFYAKANKEILFFSFMRNIQNANCASIWGQKPLHLELSHKSTAFIYLYRPQKVISPMFLDFYALKKH